MGTRPRSSGLLFSVRSEFWVLVAVLVIYEVAVGVLACRYGEGHNRFQRLTNSWVWISAGGVLLVPIVWRAKQWLHEHSETRNRHPKRFMASRGKRRGALPPFVFGREYAKSDASCILGDIDTLDIDRATPGQLRGLPDSDTFRPIFVLGGVESPSVMVGFSLYGRGRVVLTTHPVLSSHTVLLPGYLRWLGIREGCTVWGSQYRSRLGIPPHLVRKGVHFKRRYDSWYETPVLPGDVIIIDDYRVKHAISDQDIRLVQKWVRQGGYLVTGAIAWVWTSDEDIPVAQVGDVWMNRLIEPFGARYVEGYSTWRTGESANVFDEEGKKVGTVIRQ